MLKVSLNKQHICKQKLSPGRLRCRVWYKITDVSKLFPAFCIRAMTASFDTLFISVQLNVIQFFKQSTSFETRFKPTVQNHHNMLRFII